MSNTNKNPLVTIVGYIFIFFCLWQGVQVIIAGMPKQTAQASPTPSIGSGVQEIKSVDFKQK
jgi:hypothetical protein